MRIGITYNTLPETNSRLKTDKYAEFDDISVIISIKEALESYGYEVILIEADENAYEKLKYSKLDFVFNIAEGLYGESRESHIPAMLEMLKIPYTGSGVLTQAITLDKKRAKEILLHYGIPTPRFQLFTSPNEKIDLNLRFPLFVKPNAEGSSKGITRRSLVNTEQELRKVVTFIINRYHQPALVEEFMDGREFTVSILGNDPPVLLPIVEILFDNLPKNVPNFDCYEVKWFWDSPNTNIETVACPARIDENLENEIKRIALATYKVLGCVDFCRIDLRLDRDGMPNVLDINALPGIIPDPKENSRFPKACYAMGMTYNEIIFSVLKHAMKRYKMNAIPVMKKIFNQKSLHKKK